jgi:hypothetical protein
MRSIAEIREGRVSEKRVDPEVMLVFRSLPVQLMSAMARKHGGSREHIYGCRECWLVAKDVYNAMLAMREKEER